MLLNISNKFINDCNELEVIYSEYLMLDGKKIPIKAELSDDSYENGNFIGTFIFKTLKFETDSKYNFKLKEFEYYKVVNGESVKIGTFITTDLEINDTLETVKVVAMDYGLKTQVAYASSLDYASGTVTLLDVWKECCDICGLEAGTNSFVNEDFIVDSDQFTGTGATVRDVFMAIAMSSGNFVKVKNDDKIYLVFTEDTTDVVIDYVELEDKRDTRPWTCLRLGMSQVEGENVDYIDENLVRKYGENWLILNDNPFAYSQAKRQLLIENIFNQIKEFGYSAFVSKTSFKPYLTCGDVIQFKNRKGELVKTIVLRYSHNFDEITLEAPSETSATVNYVYPFTEIDVWKRTEAKVDKNTQDIELLSSRTSAVETDLVTNRYTIEQTNDLVVNYATGVTNTFSEAGGNNIFRNTGLWFKGNESRSLTYPRDSLFPSDETFTGGIYDYEYWDGNVKRMSEENSANLTALVLQNGILQQEQFVPNGTYTISFKYKKLIPLANFSVKINDLYHTLEATETTEFVETIEVNSQHVTVQFITDTLDSVEVYDIMVNAGAVKLAYSQNQNETTTDTVNISKGITITSSDTETIFKANSDGIRTLDLNGNVLAKFTDKGMTTKSMIVENEAIICNTLVQEVGDQTWFTRL